MGIGDWLGRRKDPVLQHLVDAYRLHGGAGNRLEGRFRTFSLRTLTGQSFAKGIDVELADCGAIACFGFYRPDPEDLREAVAFATDGMERWQGGESVHLAGFFIDCESGAEWLRLLERRALGAAEYLRLYSPALAWVYLNFPGLALRFAAPRGDASAALDLQAIDRDLATSARLLDFLRDAAARDGVAP